MPRKQFLRINVWFIVYFCLSKYSPVLIPFWHALLKTNAWRKTKSFSYMQPVSGCFLPLEYSSKPSEPLAYASHILIPKKMNSHLLRWGEKCLIPHKKRKKNAFYSWKDHLTCSPFNELTNGILENWSIRQHHLPIYRKLSTIPKEIMHIDFKHYPSTQMRLISFSVIWEKWTEVLIKTTY